MAQLIIGFIFIFFVVSLVASVFTDDKPSNTMSYSDSKFIREYNANIKKAQSNCIKYGAGC